MQQERRSARTARERGGLGMPEAGFTGPGRKGLPRPISRGSESTTRVLQLATDRDEPDEHLFRRLLGAYLNGVRTVEVVGRPRLTNDARRIVREFVARTRGFRLVQTSEELLRLDGFEDGSELSVAAQLWRLGELTVSFHRVAVGSWGKLPLRGETCWQEEDDRVDREAWYVQRLLALSRNEGVWGLPPLGAWTIAHAYERAADHAMVLGRAGEAMIELGSEHEKVRALRQLHTQAIDHLEAIARATNATQANELIDVGEALLASGRSIAEGLLALVGTGALPPMAALAFDRALGAVRETISESQEIAHVLLDRTLGVRSGSFPERELHTAP